MVRIMNVRESCHKRHETRKLKRKYPGYDIIVRGSIAEVLNLSNTTALQYTLLSFDYDRKKWRLNYVI